MFAQPHADMPNNLLRSLRADDLDLLRPCLSQIKAARGTVFYQPGDHVRTVYFPCGPAAATFRIELPEGKAVETAMIGREGAVGGVVSQGRLPAFAQCVVQFPGTFLAMQSVDLEEAKARLPTLRHLFARYADCMIAQVFQATACNAAHTIDQRAAKWLIAAIERTGENLVLISQEQLAEMLGIGRSYMSQVVASFKARGLVETVRGGLRVLDIEGLRQSGCDCNGVIRRHFDEVLRGVYPTERER